MEGPRLQGVYGRTSGDVAGFDYFIGVEEGAYRLERYVAGAMLAIPTRWSPATTCSFMLQNRRSDGT